MRTKEPTTHKTNYAEVSRRSIARDFKTPSYRQEPRPQTKTEGQVRRVLAIAETSVYAYYKRFFIGKLVRILRPASSGGYYVEFVKEQDAKMLNANAGWTTKREYLLDGAKYD